MFKKIIAVEHQGKTYYLVRRLSIFGYEYLDAKNQQYWWSDTCALNYSLFKSYRDANIAMKTKKIARVLGMRRMPLPETELDKLLEE